MSTAALHYPPSPRLERRWLQFCRCASAAAGVLAVLSLLAAERGVRIPALAGVHWTWLSPGAAIAYLLAAGMAALGPGWRRGMQVLAILALAWSLLALQMDVLELPGPWPARLDPALLLTALLAVAALLPLRPRLPAALLGLFGLFSGLMALLERALNLPWQPLGPHTPALSVVAGAGMVLLTSAWIAAEPRLRPLSFVHEPGSTGWMMRRLALVVLIFPLLFAWLRAQGHNPHRLQPWAVSLIFVSLCFLVFLTLLWKAAGALDKLDISRADLQAYAHEISDLYDHAPCGYHSLDAEGRIVKINETELKWLGYKRQELVGRALFPDLLTAASRVAFLRHFPKLQQAGTVQDLELELRCKDGSLLPVVVSASAITDYRGKFLRTRSTLFDISARKQAEAALRLSEARNRAVLASAAEAIVTLSETGAIEDFNPAAELMFGLRRSVAVEMMGGDLLAPDSPLRRQPLAQLARGSEEGPVRHIEFYARRADGSVFPAELTLTRVAGQSPNLFTAFVRDLTERKRAEAELRNSEERLRLLLDSTGEGIYALDLVGNCILCNPAALRMLGYERAEDLLGRPIHNLIHHTRADGRPYPAHECRSFLAARQGIGIEVDDELFFRKDGTGFPVEYRSYPVDRNGQPMGLVVTFTDVTERRNLETQMRQSQKMEAVGRLAAGIAHDFNNLLTVINGYSELLLETAGDVDTRDKLRSVRAAGDRAATLTHQLLAFSRQQVLQPRQLNLNAVVRDLEPLLRRSISEDIELTCVLAPELPPVKADPSQLDQVLMNLVVNARDAMPGGGRLRIETSTAALDEAAVRAHTGLAPGLYVVLAVSDTGTGMGPEIQSHIFEPFFTTKPQGKGTGLGLPTVFGIARQSGGTVAVETRWGRGTTMRLYLPVGGGADTAVASAARASQEATERPSGGETVLVVEDESELRRFLVEVLQERGYRVLEAGRAESALEMSAQYAHPVSLLITDVVMPGLNGVALAQRLTQQRPGLRVLYISGYSDPSLAPKPCLQKPFTPDELAQTVRAVLDRIGTAAVALA
ncbi:MAG: PAS domain S-box protein [Terriglobales bacterium]